MRISLTACALGALTAGTAAAQAPRFSFTTTWHGPTMAAPDPITGTALTEGDILVPSTGPWPFGGPPTLGPLFTPTILIPHAAMGLAPGCPGHPPGTPCWVEVDGYSFAADIPIGPNGLPPGALWFSVDEFATGFGASPVPPNLSTEAPAGESSADAFLYPLFIPPGPMPSFAVPPMNYGVVDGDGFQFFGPWTMPGTGLVEPNPPIPGPLSIGDNMDGFNVLEGAVGSVLLFSLDSPFLDPVKGVAHSASAPIHGFSGGDILTPGAVGPVIWAPAPVLGLDLFGPFTDDIDALCVWDNGDGFFQPSFTPLDWNGGNTDMVLFSVRRGSRVIGVPDSIFGIPIEEGDVLTTPLGGIPGTPPGIMIAAENLGLVTRRSMGVPFGDDLDALDIVRRPLHDCDGNGVEDAMDIFNGVALDANLNGVPDACEPGVGTPYGFCTIPVAPCGNPFPAGGCINASGTGAIMSGGGTPSVAADNLVLTTTGMNPAGFALTFMGTAAIPTFPWHNGSRCVAGSVYRFPPYPTLAGTASLGPGIVGMSIALNPPAGHITAGSTWFFQTWYRDVGGPCGFGSNFSNGLAVTFTP